MGLNQEPCVVNGGKTTATRKNLRLKDAGQDEHSTARHGRPWTSMGSDQMGLNDEERCRLGLKGEG